MKAPQVNFLAFSSLGIVGNISNEYSRNSEIARITGNSQISETIETFTSLAGFIDLFFFPVLSGAYIGFMVYLYQNKIKNRFNLPKPAMIIILFLIGIIGWIVLLFTVGLILGSL